MRIVVVYLAVVQGSTSAGQSLSFGPSKIQSFVKSRKNDFDVKQILRKLSQLRIESEV